MEIDVTIRSSEAPACGGITAQEREALMREAAHAQRALAQDRFADAEEHVLAFLDRPGSDKIWGLALLQAIIRRVREQDPSRADELQVREAELSAAILASGCSGGERPWAHAWEQARQLNERAWRAYEGASTTDELEDALTDVQESLSFWPYFLPHLDTKIRILLALDREEEAWEVVRWSETIQPGWVDFTDIVGDRRYVAWTKRQSSPPRIPAGRATAGPVTPAEPSTSIASDTGAPLSPDECARLLTIRLGDDEWHRARNDALLALALDPSLPFEEAWRASPTDFDLSNGVWRRPEGDLPLPREILARLRHALLFVGTNHVQMQQHPGKQLRKRLFLEYDLRPMTRRSVHRLLRQVGDAAGIPGLTPQRCQQPGQGWETAPEG